MTPRYRRVLSWGAAVAAVLALSGAIVLAVGLGVDAPAPRTYTATATPKASPAPQIAAPTPEPTPTAESNPEVPDIGASRLVVPGLDLDMYVDSVSRFRPGRLEGTVELPLPASVDVAAHWEPAAGLADDPDGVTVVAGHVVWNGVWSPLRGLAGLNPGAEIFTSDADGNVQAWRLDRIEQAPKRALPQEFFADDADQGERQLVIVTCGGPTGSDDHHTNNILAYAVPIG